MQAPPAAASPQVDPQFWASLQQVVAMTGGGLALPKQQQEPQQQQQAHQQQPQQQNAHQQQAQAQEQPQAPHQRAVKQRSKKQPKQQQEPAAAPPPPQAQAQRAAVEGEFSLLVANLGSAMTAAELETYFRLRYPSVTSAAVPVWDRDGLPKGFGFVRFGRCVQPAAGVCLMLLHTE
jgi:hypothetical protein